MAITYVAGNEGTPTSSLSNKSTVTKPSGLAVDDVMVAYTVSNLNGMTAPAGWTQILSRDASTGNLFRVRVFYKVATSSDVAASSFVFNDSDTSSPCWAAIGAYRGVDTANPIDASDSDANTSTTSHTTPGVTTTHSTMILSHRAVRRQGTTTFSSGVAHERFEGSNIGSSIGYSAAMYDAGTETDAGSIPGVAITANSSSNISDSIVTTVALKTLIVAVSASAGVASAVATGKTPTLDLEASPAAGRGVASAELVSPVAGVGARAGVASATSSLPQVDVFTTPFINAPAGRAQATSSVKQTRMTYAPAGKAAASVVVAKPLTSVGNRADTAQTLAAAYNTKLGFGVSAGVAHVTAVGQRPGPGLGAVIGTATAEARSYSDILYFGSTRMISIAWEKRAFKVPSEDPRPFGIGEFIMTTSPDFLKDPDDVLDYSFDWSDWLTTNEVISTFVAIATPGITIDSTSNTATVTTTWLSGGVAGSPYTITHRIVTNQDRTVDRSMTIRVTSR